MNIKRAVGFGAMLWILIFVLLSILLFLPFLEGRTLAVHVIFWIFLIPIVLLLAKWYFKADPPTMKKGFFLGIIGVIVGIILDLIITVPLFIKSYDVFFTDWMLWFSLVEVVVLTTFAGFEFDKTFTKMERK